MAVQPAEQLYRTLLRDTNENDVKAWKVEQYLQSLCTSDVPFDFQMARNEESSAATTVVWQTGTI